MEAESALNHDYFEAVVGALSAVMLLLIIAIVIIILMNHRKKTMQETPVVIFSTPSLEAGVKVCLEVLLRMPFNLKIFQYLSHRLPHLM